MPASTGKRLHLGGDNMEKPMKPQEHCMEVLVIGCLLERLKKSCKHDLTHNFGDSILMKVTSFFWKWEVRGDTGVYIKLVPPSMGGPSKFLSQEYVNL
jgi:hypothetical protein